MENQAAYNQAFTWAQRQLAAGVDPEALVAGLMKQGWPEFPARQVLDAALTGAAPAAPVAPRPVVQYASPARPAAQRSYAAAASSGNHGRNMLIGGLVCGLGIAITVGTYSAASSGSGGSYTVCYGAMIFGGIQFIRGFFGWVGGG